MDAAFYTRTPGTPEEIAESDLVFVGLTEAVRELALAQLQTRVDHAEVEAVTAEVRALTARLQKEIQPGAFGTELGPNDEVRNHGNTVEGLRNPIAFLDREDGLHWTGEKALASFHLNALYEGPPGLVHGGVSALFLDQLLGYAAAKGGGPGMTGRLTVTYRRPTPLGDLSGEAWVDRREGIKTIVKGHILDADGNVTVEAEGLFILPRWARDLQGQPRSDTPFE